MLKLAREGNPDALSSIQTYHPKADSFGGLRDAQLVIARSYGFAGWAELGDAVAELADKTQTLDEKAALFIRLSCVQYNGADNLRHYRRAQKLLHETPDLGDYDFYCALVANNLKAVEHYVISDPAMAIRAGGPLDWPPLLYVLYSRVDEAEGTRDSLSIVRLLLENGADPDSHVILNDTYRFTALTGAMGEGERGADQPPHHHADDMVALLLDAGANPNEGQGLYNTLFTDSADKWLALLLSKGLTSKHRLNWDATDEQDPVMTLDYQLSSAVDGGRLTRVNMLLAAGANPNTRNTYNGKDIHTNALLAGHDAIAKVLLDNGALPIALDEKDQFRLACVRADKHSISSQLDASPQLINDAALLHSAAENADFNIVKELVSKGFDVNSKSNLGRTLLHHFALKNDAEKIGCLLDLGAQENLLDRSYETTAAGFAAHSGSYEAMRLLLDASDNLLDVVSCAYVPRAKALIERQPHQLQKRTQRGNTLLHVIGMWLHDEPEYAVYQSMVALLIGAGADIKALNKQSQTAEEFSLANGYDALAELLSEYR